MQKRGVGKARLKKRRELFLGRAPLLTTLVSRVLLLAPRSGNRDTPQSDGPRPFLHLPFRGSGAMSATLRDLGPADKQKVATLIRQVIDKERTIRELEAAAAEAAEAAAAGQGQGGPRADQLADQNLELARENTRCVGCDLLSLIRGRRTGAASIASGCSPPTLARHAPPPLVPTPRLHTSAAANIFAACEPSCPMPLTCCAPTSTSAGCWMPLCKSLAPAPPPPAQHPPAARRVFPAELGLRDVS